MNNLLPVLQQNIPQMSLCSLCPKPGSCCSNFVLSRRGETFSVWEENWESSALSLIAEYALPFIPQRFEAHGVDEQGDVWGVPRFRCTELLADGRCGIYSTRPDVCRAFVPGREQLCGFYKEVR